ncbi:MAG: Fe2+-dependent dioxygenase [Aphanocapsa sp. GSE-SYN-MK-11-07L]|jgi:PKHD-type hydroxylase|nr:Fe2+-dependent dioxygenase [Aphanocapsa sp. GSE-SYN-MK-11-07L]
MLLCIADVLDLSQVESLVDKLNQAKFVDGKLTAGWHARMVKHNTQLHDDGGRLKDELQQTVLTALQQNSLLQMAAHPKQIRPPLFSRYQEGMHYGTHVDNALMGKDADLIRSDISLTLFLSDPDSYTGGELVIESTQGEQAFKLPAGAMIIYPSSTLHRVEPVNQGVRLAAVTWVQSFVKDTGDREILFDLDTARHSLFEKYGKSAEFDLLSKSHANLLRKWADV